jgi:hypothetical protein
MHLNMTTDSLNTLNLPAYSVFAKSVMIISLNMTVLKDSDHHLQLLESLKKLLVFLS